MPQNTSTLTVAREWDFLEPAMHPNKARTDHAKLTAAAAGTTVTYPVGQVIAQKDDGTNEFAKLGTAGFDGPRRIIKYPVTVNELGYHQKGSVYQAGTLPDTFEGSIGVYYQGYFKTQDLVGLTDDAVMATVGNLVRGTRTAGIIELIP